MVPNGACWSSLDATELSVGVGQREEILVLLCVPVFILGLGSGRRQMKLVAPRMSNLGHRMGHRLVVRSSSLQRYFIDGAKKPSLRTVSATLRFSLARKVCLSSDIPAAMSCKGTRGLSTDSHKKKPFSDADTLAIYGIDDQGIDDTEHNDDYGPLRLQQSLASSKLAKSIEQLENFDLGVDKVPSQEELEELDRIKGIGIARQRVQRMTLLESEDVAILGEVSRCGARRVIPIPAYLYERFDKVIAGRELPQLTIYYNKLRELRMERYKELASSGEAEPIRYSWKESLAFATYDMVPNFALNRRILRDVLNRVTEEDRERWKSMLDFGGGPGTAILSAREESNLPNFSEALLVEPSRSMWEIAVHLINDRTDYDGEHPEDILQKYRDEKEAGTHTSLLWVPSLTKLLHKVKYADFPRHDIVNCSFALSELPSNQARDLTVGLLWSLVKPGGVLIIAERADIEVGQAIVQRARELLLEEKESLGRAMHRLMKVQPFDYSPKVIAPCTHSKPCPMFTTQIGLTRFSKGCFFRQEAKRMVTTRGNKGQGHGRQSAPIQFSYVAFKKDLLSDEEVAEAEHATSRAKRERQLVGLEPLQDPRLSNVDDAAGEDAEPGLANTSGLDRLVRAPMLSKRHVTLDLCTSNGELDRVVMPHFRHPDHGAFMYRMARKANWGALWFFGKHDKEEQERIRAENPSRHKRMVKNMYKGLEWASDEDAAGAFGDDERDIGAGTDNCGFEDQVEDDCHKTGDSFESDELFTADAVSPNRQELAKFLDDFGDQVIPSAEHDEYGFGRRKRGIKERFKEKDE